MPTEKPRSHDDSPATKVPERVEPSNGSLPVDLVRIATRNGIFIGYREGLSMKVVPELVKINLELGILIAELSYVEYREFAGMLVLLREEEDKGIHRIDRVPAPQKEMEKNERMSRLMRYIEYSSHRNIRRMKPLIIQRSKFHERDVMAQLVFLTRLYYPKGVNMLDPQHSDATKKLQDGEHAVLRLNGDNVVLGIKKCGEIMMVYYRNPDRNEFQTEMLLRDGDICIFGRRSRDFTAKNHSRNLNETLPHARIFDLELGVSIARAGITVEIRGDEVAFFDRASGNDMTISSDGNGLISIQKLRKELRYSSHAQADKNGIVQLGSTTPFSPSSR